VVFERAFGDGFHLVFTESPFINDVGVAGVIEKSGCDPWLRNRCRQTSVKGGGKTETKWVRTSVDISRVQNVFVSILATASDYDRLDEPLR